MRLCPALILLLVTAGCGDPGEAVVAGQYDGGFPEGAHFERLTVEVVTDPGSGRIVGRGWLRQRGRYLSLPVVTGATLRPPGEEGGRESVMLLLEYEGGIATLYAGVARSGRRLEGVFNGRGGGVPVSLHRVRAPRGEGTPE